MSDDVKLEKYRPFYHLFTVEVMGLQIRKLLYSHSQNHDQYRAIVLILKLPSLYNNK